MAGRRRPRAEPGAPPVKTIQRVTVPDLDPYTFHFDLRAKPLDAGANLDGRLAYLGRITADPVQSNPVTVIQLALGALQLRDPGQLPLVSAVVEWLERWTDDRGLLAYRFPMPHTFPLDAPWYSCLAQGEAASLLVRAGDVLGRPELFELADRVIEPLLTPESSLVAATADGTVLQEYPTNPPSHVLNGWITALFGLHDLAQAPREATAGTRRAGEAFDAGTATLETMLHLYRTPIGWSLYDLYPHPIPNTASVAYQRLHVEQLRELHSLTKIETFATTAGDWERSLENPVLRLVAVGRKVAFRLVRPRSRRVKPRH